MYISRVTLEQGPTLFNLLKQRKGTDGYYIHQLLWNLFPGDSEKREFLFFKDISHGMPHFLLVSKSKPVEIDGMVIETKDYEPHLVPGQKLSFSLLANPVVARQVKDKKNSAKHDLWVDSRKIGKEKGLKDMELREFCEDSVKDWLIKQGKNKHGFELLKENVLIDGHQKHTFKKGRGGNLISFNTIRYQGILKVTEVERFKRMLYTGIGRSRSFGCGLMLVRKV